MSRFLLYLKINKQRLHDTSEKRLSLNSHFLFFCC